MESVKQDIPDTLWIGFGRKDAPIVQNKTRFLSYFHSWMQPYKFRVKNVEFWPGFAWGTIKMESGEARNTLLKHVIDKPFRPDNEAGWVLNKFEKCLPVDTSPKKSPKKCVSKDVVLASISMAAAAKRRSTVAENLLTSNHHPKEKTSRSKGTAATGRRSRSTTSSPATVISANHVLDLDDDLELSRRAPLPYDLDEDDDSELRVRATVTKVISGVRVVEALTKKHGIYKLSINDIVGASKFKPTDLTGADIVIVLGPLKRNQRRRDFLWAEISEDWTGPPPPTEAATPSDGAEEKESPTDEAPPLLIKEETLENALVNLKKFYRWSMKDGDQAQRHISALLDEVANAESMQMKVAIISDHLTLASQSFTGMQDAVDDESVMEELISSTRCSSAFSDVKRVVSNVDYEKEASHRSDYRRSDIIVKEDTIEDKLKLMQDMLPTEDATDFNPRNILNLSDSPVPKSSRQESSLGRSSDCRSSDKSKNDHVFDLPTSRQTIKANASSYTVESSSEIQIDMIYWQKMLHWLTVHHFDDHKEQAKDHAKWVVIVWELAGITPTNLKSEIVGHQQTLGKLNTGG